MILEVVILNIKEGLSIDFEVAFKKAEKIIASMDGYISHQLKKFSHPLKNLIDS